MIVARTMCPQVEATKYTPSSDSVIVPIHSDQHSNSWVVVPQATVVEEHDAPPFRKLVIPILVFSFFVITLIALVIYAVW